MQARVLGYVFNPISVFWCHDADGVLRHVIAEVHNTYGGRHAYLLPPDGDQPAMVTKKLYVSPFNDVDGYYLVRAPRPDDELDVRDLAAPRATSPRSSRRCAARVGERGDRSSSLRLQIVAPLAPLMGAIWIRIQGITLWLRRVSRRAASPSHRAGEGRPAVTIEAAGNPPRQSIPTAGPPSRGCPRGPVSAAAGAVADRLLRRAAARLPIRLVYPDGTVIGAADPTLPTMVIHQPEAMARRVGRYGLIGFGESYMAGEWSSDDLAGLLTVFANSVAELIPPALQRLRPLAVVRQPRSQHNSRAQARRNIAEHYDLSNDLFAEFLDETMTYSSALFDDAARRRQADLADAQRRKIDRLLDAARVGPGSRVLEIGTGWGELCIRAAARGAHVHSITLSAEQQRLARQRVAAAGLSDRVDDRTVRLPRRRRPLRRRGLGGDDRGGRIPVLADVLPDARPAGGARRPGRDPGDHHAARPDAGHPQHLHLDPEVHLPRRAAAVGRGDLSASPNATPGCAPSTCSRCDRTTPRRCGCGGSASCERRDAVAALGFDDVFHRMWELYLAYSEAGFRSGYLDVYQWTFAPTGAMRR